MWKRRVEFSEGSTDVPPVQMPDAIWDLLSTRGFTTKEDIESLIKPRLSSLRDPSSILNMDLATERLVEVFKKKQKITIYADFDLDGTSGLALMLEGLKALGFQSVEGYQPKRLSDGYGLHVASIDEMKESGCDLVVTVDVGITAMEAAQRAKEVGLDLIITDHHQPKEELPEAFAVVNPNQKTDQSGLGHLSGAGVAYYLLLSLRRALKEDGVQVDAFDPKELLEFFCIGTVTDLVPMKDENRILVRHGLHRFKNTKWPGLKALMEQVGLQSKSFITSQDIGIQLAPKLNALSRMELDHFPVDVLIADSTKAEELALETMKVNQTRKSLQKVAEEKALKEATKMSEQGFVFLADGDFHKGVVGLVAIKLAIKLGVPTFIGAIDDDGVITGSARKPDDYAGSLLDILGSAESELIQFGGHNEAAGFKCRTERVEDIKSRMSSYLSEAKDLSESATLYDLDVEIDDVTPELMNWMTALEPFGKGFEYPLFRVTGARVREARVLKGAHLKLKLAGKRVSLDAIYFSAPSSLDLQVGDAVDILGEIQWNEFRGRRNLQIMVKLARKKGV